MLSRSSYVSIFKASDAGKLIKVPYLPSESTYTCRRAAISFDICMQKTVLKFQTDERMICCTYIYIRVRPLNLEWQHKSTARVYLFLQFLVEAGIKKNLDGNLLPV